MYGTSQLIKKTTFVFASSFPENLNVLISLGNGNLNVQKMGQTQILLSYILFKYRNNARAAVHTKLGQGGARQLHD
jgi:hypothetical protein